MALAYVARFATSRGKLVRYLDRKVRERGWAGTADGRTAARERSGAALGRQRMVAD